MNIKLKSFLIGTFLAVFLVAGVAGAIYISWRLGQPGPVAPNVPQIKPQASEPTVTAACNLTFTVAALPPPPPPPPSPPPPPPPALKSCNETCTVNGDCMAGFVCAGGNCRNPSCINQSSCVCPAPPPVAGPPPPPPPAPRPVLLPTGAELPTVLAIISGLALLAARLFF